MIQVLFQEAFQNVDCMHYPSAQQPQHNCISSVFSDERCVWVKHLVIQKKHQKKKKKKSTNLLLTLLFQGSTLPLAFLLLPNC